MSPFHPYGTPYTPVIFYIMFIKLSLILWLLCPLLRYSSGSDSFNEFEYESFEDIVCLSDEEGKCDRDTIGIDDFVPQGLGVIDYPIEWDVASSLDFQNTTDPYDNTADSSDTNPLFNQLVFEDSLPRTERTSIMRKRLKDIIKFQFPDVAANRISLNDYHVENWPESVGFYKTYWSKADIKKINESIPLLKFHPKVMSLHLTEELCLEKIKCLVEAENDASLTYESFKKIVTERFKAECGHINGKYINWMLLNRRSIPEKYNEVPLNSRTIQSPLIYRNREILDNIHFCSNEKTGTDLKDKDKVKSQNPIYQSLNQKLAGKCVMERSKILKHELKALLQWQHPGTKLHPNHFNILNWPEGVPQTKTHWSGLETKLIVDNFNELEFIPKATNPSFTWISVSELYQRSRDETGNRNAESVQLESDLPLECSDASTMSGSKTADISRKVEKKRKFNETESDFS